MKWDNINHSKTKIMSSEYMALYVRVTYRLFSILPQVSPYPVKETSTVSSEKKYYWQDSR